jgi:predicted ATP-dependent serine protease
LDHVIVFDEATIVVGICHVTGHGGIAGVASVEIRSPFVAKFQAASGASVRILPIPCAILVLT